LHGVGCDQWICRDQTEMVGQALRLANDLNRLKELRLQQRQKVAQSELLDHAGLASSLEHTFRQWWLQWLQKQGWPTNAKHAAWPPTAKTKAKTQLVPVSNSISQRLPLWLGPLQDAERDRREALGQRVVPLENLNPWGTAVSLFSQEQPNSVLAWLETGASTESQHWWQHTYPQLIWELEGPLASR